MMGVLSLFGYHVAKHQSSLLDRAGQAFAIVHRAQPAIVHFLRRASCHERLLCGGLRHDLGFLVSHFWLLSESLDSLFVLFFTFSVSGTRRAELVKSINQNYALLSEDSESPTSSLVSFVPSADRLSLSAELSSHAAFCAFFSLYNFQHVLLVSLILSHMGPHTNFMIRQAILSTIFMTEIIIFMIVVILFFLLPLFRLRQKKEGAILCRSSGEAVGCPVRTTERRYAHWGAFFTPSRLLQVKLPTFHLSQNDASNAKS